MITVNVNLPVLIHFRSGHPRISGIALTDCRRVINYRIVFYRFIVMVVLALNLG